MNYKLTFFGTDYKKSLCKFQCIEVVDINRPPEQIARRVFETHCRVLSTVVVHNLDTQEITTVNL